VCENFDCFTDIVIGPKTIVFSRILGKTRGEGLFFSSKSLNCQIYFPTTVPFRDFGMLALELQSQMEVFRQKLVFCRSEMHRVDRLFM
jgi:hypothetical protein